MSQDTTTARHAPGRAPRADTLERLFGDPRDPANPVGHGPILAADDRAEMFAEGEALLDGFGLNAEFVPTRYGGRLDRLDDLVEVMRAVYRRDPSLGLGYGASSLISSVNVWTSADEDQSRRVAELLLGNGKIAAAYHELAHGNDMSGTEMNAAPVDDGWCLNGRKEVVTNIRRADALVLFTRTGSGEGSRNHSQLLVDKERVLGGGIRYLPRYGTVGLRGVQLAGAVFENCRLGPEALIGGQGHGLETAMRSFQVTRATLPAMMTAILDSALRATLLHVNSRSLYGRRVADLPQVRAQLAGAFADLLACEAFSMVAVRALHLLPEVAGLYAASVKYAVAGALLRAVDRLSAVLGAEFFHRDGEQAIFQKLLRDLKPVGFGHAARAACQTTILPQLGILARRPLTPAALPEALFRIDSELPEMSFGALRISSGGRDPLAAALEELADETSAHGDARLTADVAGLRSELAAVRAAAGVLTPRELTFTTTPDAYELVERYVHVLVGIACLRVWWHNRDGSDAFLAEPLWLRAALARVRTAWSGRPAVLPPETVDGLFAQLQIRLAEPRSFGLLGRHLSGT